jgi:putative FmdB family regulatory protein
LRAVPTYDYLCRSCGTVTEVIHSMLADGPTICERCGGALRRVFYPTGIIFKGSGFYSTDSRARGSTATSESSGGSSDGASGASGASGESSEKAPSGKASDTSSPSSSDGGGSNGSRGESSSRSKKTAPSGETG